MSISELVKKRMLSSSINITELSKRSGVSYSSLQRFISGESDLGASKFVLVLKALGVDLESELNDQRFGRKVKLLPDYLKQSLSNIIGG